MAVYKREYKSRGRAVWYYQFRFGGRKRARAGFPTKGAAEEAERREMASLRSRMGRPVPKADVTVDQFMPTFLAFRNMDRSESGAKREERRAKPVASHFRGMLLREVTAGDVQAYVMRRKRQDGLANRSINLELCFLRSLYRHAVDNGYAEENPAKPVKNLRETHTKRPDFFEPHFIAFAKAAETAPTAKVFVPWVWFRAYTGTRPAESVFVEWQDIDFEKGHIHIVPKPGNPLKNGEARVVDIHESLAPILLDWRREWQETFKAWRRRHRRRQPHDWVFYNPCNQRVRAQSFLAGFRTARKKAKLPEMTPYTFRHFFISYCVMNEIPMLTIARWAGHTSTRMIEQVYGHLTPRYRAQQMTRFRITRNDEGDGSEEEGQESEE